MLQVSLLGGEELTNTFQVSTIPPNVAMRQGMSQTDARFIDSDSESDTDVENDVVICGTAGPSNGKQTETSRTTPRSRVLRLLADSSPDTTLPSFKDLIQRRGSKLVTQVSVDVEPSRATSDLSMAVYATRDSSTRAMSKRTVSQPDLDSAEKRRRLATSTSAMADVIEIGSESVIDPTTSQESVLPDMSSPIRIHYSNRALPASRPPNGMSKTVSAPIVILSSSPSSSQTEGGNAVPLPFSSQGIPSSPVRALPALPSTSSLATVPRTGAPMQRTKSLLDALDELHGPTTNPISADTIPEEPLFLMSQATDDGFSAPRQASKRAAASSKATVSASKTKEAKESAKEAREAKAREREQAKQNKLQQAQEAKRWKEVNKLRSNKSDTMRELIVDLDTALFAPGQPLAGCKESIQTRLEQEGAAAIHFKDNVISPPMIRYRRKVKASYDEQRRHWIPLAQEEIVPECTAIVYVDATEIVELVASNSLMDWYEDLQKRLNAQSKSNEFQIFMVVQGLLKYYSKIRANENRAYAARIRNQLAQEAATETEPEQVRVPTIAVAASPQDEVERALLQLKFVHRCHVIHVGALVDGVEWIHQLTSDISIRPYKALRDSHLTFAVDTSRNTAAYDNCSLWSMMLQQIPRVTTPIAESIASVYPTLQSLVRAYKQCPDLLHQNQLLSSIQIQSNVNGTERRGNRTNLGPQLSKRIRAVLQNNNADLLINNPTKD